MNGKITHMDHGISINPTSRGSHGSSGFDEPTAEYEQDSLFSFDFASAWAAIYRSRFWLAGIVAGALLIGVVITVLSTPIYRATSTVQIDQEAAKVLGTEDANASAAIQDSDRFLKTQVDVIRSRSLAEAVAEDLKLFNTDEFLDAMDVDPDSMNSDALTPEQAQRELVLNTLSDNLLVSLPVDSRIASISFDSADPALAARIANSFAQNYIRNNLQRKFDTSSYAREFLKQQLDEAAIRLANSEREALDYARRTRVIDATNAAGSDVNDSTAPKSLVTATLVKLNQDYAEAVARRIEFQQKWETSKGTDVMALPEVLANFAIQSLLQQKALVQSEYEQQLQRRKESFPTVKQAKARLDELDSQIAAIAAGIRQTLRGNYEAALAQEQALSAQIAELKDQTLNEQDQAVQLGILKRNTSNARKLYDLLNTRYNEINAEAGVQANNLSIVDRADRPVEPIRPSVIFNMALALVSGLVIAALFVIGREQLFNVVRTPEDIGRKLGQPSLGAIPKMAEGFAIEQEILDPKSVLSETFSSLRSSLMLVSSHGLPRSLMFTSAKQGEGKSSCCFATAIALSRIGKRVLVIDLDLRRPNQHNKFGVKNSAGMSDLLTQNKTAAEVTQGSAFEGVFFIPSGGTPPNPAELLAGASARRVIAELEKDYDVVLIDSPPTLGLADAVEIGALAESCIFVMESSNNQAAHARNALQRLSQRGANIIGVLLTKFDMKEAGYGYEYAYQYSYT
ncbi:polysaccharide biosynthesis tyrosine autokinase [Sphingopyxis indica]|uniref:GumC family protein n=1 Tax=Sphingopyxis indica TaxID=436663 RepID=UPI00293906C2|nr:polysaccharide biosynthesis tyrosine autokinase [Sphingopyxis indica]WOF44576.1 polysaccharide biosynthesis tyrosine autokinase [Sphingopyxis indica]